MTVWKLFARGPFGMPYFDTVELPEHVDATAAREAAHTRLERHPARPSLLGVRVDAAGAPWLNAGQFRGRETALIVYAIHALAIAARPDWLIGCRQDGQWRPWGAPFEASAHPLPIRSAGYKNSIARMAAVTGQRCAHAQKAS